MFRKLWLWLWLLEIIDEEIETETPREESQKEYIERRRVEIEKETEEKETEEEQPKVKWKYIMFKESEEEKQKRKNYFTNLIDWYERVKGKQFVRKHFKENTPEKQEHFHWFLRSTREIMKIESKIEKNENKNLKKLLYFS
jgi:hypothetical protein